MRAESADAFGVTAGKTTAIGSGMGAVVAGMTANEMAAVIGATVAVLGLFVQIYYTRRRNAREEAERLERRDEHLARMRGYERQSDG